MQAIADALSDDEKLAIIREKFTTGQVFYLRTVFPSRIRDKYLLLISPDEPPLFLVFNSGKAIFIEQNPRLDACQVPIKKEIDPEAIEHDCFLDCTETKSLTFENVSNQCSKDMTRIRGTLSEKTLKEVFAALQRDKRIVLNTKLRLLGSLKR